MKTYQVVGIGNAMVDVLTRADDAFLAEAGIPASRRASCS